MEPKPEVLEPERALKPDAANALDEVVGSAEGDLLPARAPKGEVADAFANPLVGGIFVVVAVSFAVPFEVDASVLSACESAFSSSVEDSSLLRLVLGLATSWTVVSVCFSADASGVDGRGGLALPFDLAVSVPPSASSSLFLLRSPEFLRRPLLSSNSSVVLSRDLFRLWCFTDSEGALLGVSSTSSKLLFLRSSCGWGFSDPSLPLLGFSSDVISLPEGPDVTAPCSCVMRAFFSCSRTGFSPFSVSECTP
jgi:hypothetical protein